MTTMDRRLWTVTVVTSPFSFIDPVPNFNISRWASPRFPQVGFAQWSPITDASLKKGI
jgi:hypothetical protein